MAQIICSITIKFVKLNHKIQTTYDILFIYTLKSTCMLVNGPVNYPDMWHLIIILLTHLNIKISLVYFIV